MCGYLLEAKALKRLLALRYLILCVTQGSGLQGTCLEYTGGSHCSYTGARIVLHLK